MTMLTWQNALQIALAAGCVLLALYCGLLARRLRRLNDLESGLGGAIAVMSAEVSRLEAALAQTRTEATAAGAQLAAAVEGARRERALWALQSRFTPEEGPRPRRRRRTMQEADDAAA